MSNSIGDILQSKSFEEPSEIQTIKDFVEKAVAVRPQVSVSNTTFIVQLPSASAAGAMRFKLSELQSKLDTKKRIIIRIGS